MFNNIMKKRILYPVILLLQISVLFLISAIFDLETTNSWFGFIGAYVFFGTIVLFLIRIVKDHKTTLASVVLPFPFNMQALTFVYFAIGIIVLGLVLMAPLFIIDLIRNT